MQFAGRTNDMDDAADALRMTGANLGARRRRSARLTGPKWQSQMAAGWLVRSAAAAIFFTGLCICI
jgi:hypothetical protein